MKDPKTYRKIDYCFRVVDPVTMKTEECDYKEICRVWYHARDNLIIGKNFFRLTSSGNKKVDIDYVLLLSRTTNKSESADAVYMPTKPKGGARSHKKKPASSAESGDTAAAVPA